MYNVYIYIYICIYREREDTKKVELVENSVKKLSLLHTLPEDKSKIDIHGDSTDLKAYYQMLVDLANKHYQMEMDHRKELEEKDVNHRKELKEKDENYQREFKEKDRSYHRETERSNKELEEKDRHIKREFENNLEINKLKDEKIKNLEEKLKERTVINTNVSNQVRVNMNTTLSITTESLDETVVDEGSEEEDTFMALFEEMHNNRKAFHGYLTIENDWLWSSYNLIMIKVCALYLVSWACCLTTLMMYPKYGLVDLLSYYTNMKKFFAILLIGKFDIFWVIYIYIYIYNEIFLF